MDQRVLRRRRMAPVVFTIFRILIVGGVIAFFAVEIAFLATIESSVEDRGGKGHQTLRSYPASESFPAGTAVSFDDEGQVRRGFGLQSVLLTNEQLSSACVQHEILDGTCSWVSVATSEGASSIAQFRLLSNNAGGTAVSTPKLLMTHLPLSATTETATLPPQLSLPLETQLLSASAGFPQQEAVRLVYSSVDAETGSAAAVIFANYSSALGTNDHKATFILALGSGATTDSPSEVLIGVAATIYSGSALNDTLPSMNAFVHFTSGGLLLVGVQCGIDRCCLSLLDHSKISTGTLNKKESLLDSTVVMSDCPTNVAAFGEYVAFSLNPMSILRVQQTNRTGTISQVQDVLLPWQSGPLAALVAVPSSHPSARFVAFCQNGPMFRSFNIIPVTSTASTGSSTRFQLKTGVTMQSIFPLQIEAATFLPPTAELALFVSENALKYMVKVSVTPGQASLVSAPLFIELAPPHALRLAFYDIALGGVVAGGPSSRAGESQLLALHWFGGYTIAGVAQQNCDRGGSCTVVRTGISDIHGGLRPGVRYGTNIYGELIPFRSAQSYTALQGTSRNSQGHPGTLDSMSNVVVVGTAITSNELEVFLH